MHSFAVGDGEPEDADVEPVLGPQRELTPLMPSPQRSLSTPRSEESEDELTRLKEQLRIEMDKVRAESTCRKHAQR